MNKKTIPDSLVSRPGVLKESDYARWGAKDVWTLSETAALLMDWEPVPEPEIPPGPALEHFRVIRDKLERETGKTVTHFNYSIEQGHVYYPWKAIEWAESSQIRFDPKLKTAVLEAWPSQFRTRTFLAERDQLKQQIAILKSDLEKVKQTTQPAYMNPAHEYFAAELEAAVSVWMTLFNEKRFVPNVGVREQFETWIQEHRERPISGGDRFSEKAIGRIAVVATPKDKKTGGRPPAAKKT